MSSRLTLASIALPFVLLSLPGCSDSIAPELSDPRLYETVSAGGQHTCGLTLGGVLSCWGRNWSGALGDGTWVDRREPTRVANGTTFQNVSAGENHTCALTTDGVAYCWGRNNDGQLGKGAAGEDSTAPELVDTDLRFASITLAGSHTCALTSNGEAYCWGSNIYGGLGIGAEDEIRDRPTEVSTAVRFTSITAGWSHTCGLDGDGNAWCWGYAADGQVGAETEETCGDLERRCTRRPLRVEGGHRFEQLDAGSGYTCGVERLGALYCWGDGWSGQLGFEPTEECVVDEDFTKPCSKAPSPVSGGHLWAQVSAGSGRTCGITQEGAAWCWGGGALGDGSWTVSTEPVAVATTVRFSTISTGTSHSCAVAREGIAWCWGSNNYGQLGDGSPALGWPTPVAVKGG